MVSRGSEGPSRRLKATSSPQGAVPSSSLIFIEVSEDRNDSFRNFFLDGFLLAGI